MANYTLPLKQHLKDGIHLEFYKTFWNETSKIVVDSSNEAYDEGQLSECQGSAAIYLILETGDADILSKCIPTSFNFGKSIIQWDKTLYKDLISCIKTST